MPLIWRYQIERRNFSKVYIEEEGGVDDVGMVDNANKGLLKSFFQFFSLMPNNFMVKNLKTNLKVQEKILNHMCNIGARVAQKSGVSRVSDTLDVAVTADNFRISNPFPLDTIIGYIIQDSKGEEVWKNTTEEVEYH